MGSISANVSLHLSARRNPWLISRRPALDALTAELRANPALGGDVPPRIDAAGWPDIIALANEHSLCSALYASISVAGAIETLPYDVCTYLHCLYRANRRRNRIVQRQALEVVRALNCEGIEPLLLDGVLTLMSEPQLDPASRILSDIDIVVPPRSGPGAVRALERLRYAMRDRYPEGHRVCAKFRREGNPAAVTLQFELIDRSRMLPAAEVWRGARRTVGDGDAIYFCPWPTHRVLHNVLQAQVNHRGAYRRAELDLRRLYEFALLSKAFGAAAHWSYVRDRLDRHDFGTPLASYMWAAHRLLGVAWPYSETAELTARVHYRLCRARLCRPALGQLGIPWGSLSGALARYGGASMHCARGPHRRRVHRMCRGLATHSYWFVVGRLFRP